jgi:hypothetical protein
MNKRIVAISVLLLMCAMAASVFAEDNEYEYTVVVSYNVTTGTGANKKTEIKQKPYTVWATSIQQAQEFAIQLCKNEFGDVASCGNAVPTGRKR